MKVFIVFAFNLVFCLLALADAEIGAEILPIISEVLNEDESFSGEHVHVARMKALAPSEYTASIGLVTLAVLRKSQTIKLVWWKSANPKVRELCISLKMHFARDGIIKERVLGELREESKRFNKKEKAERLKEIESYMKNRKSNEIFHAEILKMTNRLKEKNE